MNGVHVPSLSLETYQNLRGMKAMVSGMHVRGGNGTLVLWVGRWCDARGTMVRCKGYNGAMQAVPWYDARGTMVR